MNFLSCSQILCVALLFTVIPYNEGMGLCEYDKAIHRYLQVDNPSTNFETAVESKPLSNVNSMPMGTETISPIENTLRSRKLSTTDEDTQCDTSDRISGCKCETDDVTSVIVNDNYFKRCYCNTPSGVKCSFIPQDCIELYESGIDKNGVYTIKTTGSYQLQFNVYCRGTWTMFQQHIDNSVNFNRSWADYQNGFGDLLGNFWLGNEKLCHMSQQRTYHFYIRYNISTGIYITNHQELKVGCSDKNYTLVSLGRGRKGNGTNAMRSYLNRQFNTCDRRQDCGCGWWCCPGCSAVTNLNAEEMEWSGLQVYSSSMYLAP